MSRVKGFVIVTALVGVTAPLMVVQALALRLRHPLSVALPVRYHRLVCRIMGIKVTVKGSPPDARPLLITANHCSWLDIPVLSSVMPVSFIAKREVGTWLVFGTLARLQRSVFVDRERRHSTHGTADEVAGRLSEGTPIVLFAEGTSSDGGRVLPFRSALIGAAHMAIDKTGAEAVSVLPVAIAYTGRGGLPLATNALPDVAWYGKVDIIPHIWGLVTRPPIDVTIAFGEPVSATRSDNRKALAARLERDVRHMTQTERHGRPPIAAPSQIDEKPLSEAPSPDDARQKAVGTAA